MASLSSIETLVIEIESDTKALVKGQQEINHWLNNLTTMVTHHTNIAQRQLNLLAAANKRALGNMVTDSDRAGKAMQRTFSFFATYGAGRFVGNMARDMREGLGGAVKQFADFDQALNNTFALAQIFNKGVRENISDTLKDLSTNSKQTPVELAEGLFHLVSAGYTADQALKMLPVTAQFATAGLMDMEMATSRLIDAQAALGMRVADPIKNMENLKTVSDAITLGAAQSNATIKDFSMSLTRDAASAARMYKQELSGVMAVLAAYAQQGIKGGKAGSDFGRTLRYLGQAFREHGEVFKFYGINVVDEATGEYRQLIDIIGDMEKAFAGMTGPQKSAALSAMGIATRSQNALMPLIGMTKQMREFQAEQQKAMGFTEKVSAEAMKSFANQCQVTLNVLTTMAIEVGEVLAPALLYLNQVLQQALAWWKALGEEGQAVLVWTTVFIAAVLTITANVLMGAAVIGLFAMGISSLVAALSAMAPVLLPILGVVAAIAALGAALVGVTAWVVGLEGMNEAWNNMVAAARLAVDMIYGFFFNFQHNVQAIFEWVKTNWMTILADMVQLAGVFAVNMGLNLGVAIETFMRLWNAMLGEIARMAKSGQLLTVFKTIAIEVVKLFALMGTAIARVMRQALTGGNINLGTILKDFQRAAGGQGDFSTRMKTILKEQAGKIKIFEGFEAQTKELPDLMFGHGKKAGLAVGEGAKAGLEEQEAAMGGAMDKMFSPEMEKFEQFVEKLREKNAVLGDGGEQSDRRKLESFRGKVPEASFAEAEHIIKATENWKKHQKMMEDAKKVLEDIATPMDKYEEKVKHLDELLKGNALTQDQYNKALKHYEKELNKDYKIKFTVEGLDALEVGTAKALAYMNNFDRESAISANKEYYKGEKGIDKITAHTNASGKGGPSRDSDRWGPDDVIKGILENIERNTRGGVTLRSSS